MMKRTFWVNSLFWYKKRLDFPSDTRIPISSWRRQFCQRIEDAFFAAWILFCQDRRRDLKKISSRGRLSCWEWWQFTRSGCTVSLFVRQESVLSLRRSCSLILIEVAEWHENLLRDWLQGSGQEMKGRKRVKCLLRKDKWVLKSDWRRNHLHDHQDDQE